MPSLVHFARGDQHHHCSLTPTAISPGAGSVANGVDGDRTTLLIAARVKPKPDRHAADLDAWSKAQANLLRAGRLAALDRALDAKPLSRPYQTARRRASKQVQALGVIDRTRESRLAHMTFKRGIAYWAVAAVVATGVLGAVVATSHSGAEAPNQLAQAYSTKCQTSGGVCYVAAQPVGSACQCGAQSGTIIP